MQYINVKVKSTIKWHGRTIHAVDGKILQPVWFLFENYSQKIKNYRDKNFNCIPNYTTILPNLNGVLICGGMKKPMLKKIM